MTLQEFIDFDQYVRCFTFGKTDIVPVAYDPHERRYLVDHEYLSPELGARDRHGRADDEQALGYEMNTIEFAVQDGVPYAIDFLNPAPDFERDRITPFYFDIVVEKMAALVIDRALHAAAQRIRGRGGRRWSASARREAFVGAAGVDAGAPGGVAAIDRVLTPRRRVARAAPARRRAGAGVLGRAARRAMRGGELTFGDRVLCPFLRPFFLDAARRGARALAWPRRSPTRRARRRRPRCERPALLDAVGLSEAERALVAHRSRLRARQHRVAARRVPPARLAAVRRVQRRVAGGPRLHREAGASVRRAADDGALPRAVRAPTYFRLIDALLDALLASYRDWGGTASPPTIAIVDWREVPTWSEFEILRALRRARRADGRRRSARPRRYDGGRADGRRPARSISSTAAC